MAISADSVDDNHNLVEKLGLDYPILSDGDRKTITAYGLLHEGASIDGSAIARPATLIIDAEGRVQWRNLTENWRVRVRPDAVIDALQKLTD